MLIADKQPESTSQRVILKLSVLLLGCLQTLEDKFGEIHQADNPAVWLRCRKLFWHTQMLDQSPAPWKSITNKSALLEGWIWQMTLYDWCQDPLRMWSFRPLHDLPLDITLPVDLWGPSRNLPPWPGNYKTKQVLERRPGILVCLL